MSYFSLCSNSCYAFITYCKCSSLMGGLTSFLKATELVSQLQQQEIIQMSPGWELLSRPIRQNIARLLPAWLWQQSPRAGLGCNKRPIDACWLLCPWYFEQEEHLGTSGNPGVPVYFVPSEQGLSELRPTSISNTQPWPPAVLSQLLCSVLSPDPHTEPTSIFSGRISKAQNSAEQETWH